MHFASGVANPTGNKRALLVHLVAAFDGRRTGFRHQNRFNALEIARQLGDRGYSVDVLEPGGAVPRSTAPYDLVIDLHPGISEYPSKPHTQRIAFITGSNPAFSNVAERARLEDLARRRGVQLTPRRQVPEFSPKDLCTCDAMFFVGNAFNLATYSNLPLPPVRFVRNFAFPIGATAANAPHKRGFLFLASTGQVHKGLDLLLEIFGRHPDWTLHVCSSFHEEPDFCRAFQRDMFFRPNIFAHGFTTLHSKQFRKIAQACSHLVLPSCSEANAGSVLCGMAAGIIPIVSRMCGFEPDEVEHLEDCGIATIERHLRDALSLDATSLSEKADRCRRIVQVRYSPEAFVDSLTHAFDDFVPKAGT